MRVKTFILSQENAISILRAFEFQFSEGQFDPENCKLCYGLVHLFPDICEADFKYILPEYHGIKDKE